MPEPTICLEQYPGGSGGYAGGDGGQPAASAFNTSGTSGRGFPVIKVTRKQKTDIDLQLFIRRESNTPYDMDGFEASGKTVWFTAREMPNLTEAYIKKQADISDTEAAEGQISLSLIPADLEYAGIWFASFAVLDSDESLLDEFPCYLEVEGSLYAPSSLRPISISELRMALRDVSAEYNTLLEELMFSDTEIAYAITRPIDEWNETPPYIGAYSPATFPYREAWKKAACGYLLRAASHHDLRNNAAVSAGGVQSQLHDKGPAYASIGNSLLTEWQQFMIRKKIEKNLQQWSGSVGSHWGV